MDIVRRTRELAQAMNALSTVEAFVKAAAESFAAPDEIKAAAESARTAHSKTWETYSNLIASAPKGTEVYATALGGVARVAETGPDWVITTDGKPVRTREWCHEAVTGDAEQCESRRDEVFYMTPTRHGWVCGDCRHIRQTG